MKIVSWNCNGKFREKYKAIKKLDADIYVIQECEDPNESKTIGYREFAKNSLWIGKTKNKGLGVFAKSNIKLRKNNWPVYCLKYFLSINVNNKFDLIGVWACKPYIEEYYMYQCINIDKYNIHTIIIGDFNSNAAWDPEHCDRSHGTVVKELSKINLFSAYHLEYNEDQGKETKGTFYLYRHQDRPYHIDGCFIDKRNISKFEIGNNKEWLFFSDHMPILLETKK